MIATSAYHSFPWLYFGIYFVVYFLEFITIDNTSIYIAFCTWTNLFITVYFFVKRCIERRYVWFVCQMLIRVPYYVNMGWNKLFIFCFLECQFSLSLSPPLWTCTQWTMGESHTKTSTHGTTVLTTSIILASHVHHSQLFWQSPSSKPVMHHSQLFWQRQSS